MTRLLFPQSAILDILERLLTNPFYCWKFAPFCERHSFLCIVAVCWWKNEAYTYWYYSILLLSVIINSVTFVTDDFIFAKMECITKLLDKNVVKLLPTSRSPSWPFLFPSVELCEICYSCYFCHICCSIFSHSLKNSCYFCDFCEICGLVEALLDLSTFQVEFCEICYSCYFCHICFSKFSHRKKNSWYFCDFCEICRHLEALLDLFSY